MNHFSIQTGSFKAAVNILKRLKCICLFVKHCVHEINGLKWNKVPCSVDSVDVVEMVNWQGKDVFVAPYNPDTVTIKPHPCEFQLLRWISRILFDYNARLISSRARSCMINLTAMWPACMCSEPLCLRSSAHVLVLLFSCLLHIFLPYFP